MPNDLYPSNNVYVSTSLIPGAGRGVFASQDIETGALIERCPIILLEHEDKKHLRETELLNYYFRWDITPLNHMAAICLGYGSIYNHSYQPNALYKKILDKNYIEYFALRSIQKGEEITVNYNGNPDDTKPLWIKNILQK